MISLLLLDIEGVLAQPGGAQYPLPLDDWLRLRAVLSDAPWATVLCSGRQSPYGEAVIQALDLYHPLPDTIRDRIRAGGGPPFLAWPSILENGAYFYDPLGKSAYPHPDISAGGLAALHRLKTEALLPLAHRTGAVVEAGKDYSISINPPLVDRYSGERQSTDAFRPLIEDAAAAFLDAVEIKHSRSAIDITPRGVGKASALRRLLAWTGLSPKEVAGVGDTTADAEWLSLVGWSAAPANGREALPGLRFYAESEVASGLLEIVGRLCAHTRSPELKAQSCESAFGARPPGSPDNGAGGVPLQRAPGELPYAVGGCGHPIPSRPGEPTPPRDHPNRP
jgi:hydroxymethylpyrimidine pyrophosphatase-like HAD family hydrolase